MDETHRGHLALCDENAENAPAVRLAAVLPERRDAYRRQ